MTQQSIQTILEEQKGGNFKDAIKSVVELFQQEKEKNKKLVEQNNKLITLLKSINEASYILTDPIERYQDICSVLDTIEPEMLLTEDVEA